MTPQENHTLSDAERQATIQELLQERMRLAIRHTMISVLEEEVENFIQAALYQRTPERRDYRNGHYERDLVTTVGEIEDLPVPRTRDGFRTQLFERYQRRQAELEAVPAHRRVLQRLRQCPHRDRGRRHVRVPRPEIDDVHAGGQQLPLAARDLGEGVARELAYALGQLGHRTAPGRRVHETTGSIRTTPGGALVLRAAVIPHDG